MPGFVKSILGRRLGINDSGQLIADGRLVGQMTQAYGNGNTFYVSSAIAAADGTSPATAVGTIAAAVAKCTANQGDVIIVLPGHAESISSNTALTMSVAGVRVVGLGYGNDRPTITLDTANTATINVSAASVSFENMIFVANFLSIAACFTLSTAKAFKLLGNVFRETSSVLNFLNIVKGTGAANTTDKLYADGNRWGGLGVTSISSFFLSADALEGVTLRNNVIVHNHAVDTSSLLSMTTGACTNLDCGDNVVITKQTACTNGSLLNVGASSTGVVYRNFAGTLLTTGDKLFTTTVGFFAFENRVAGVVGATGFVIPTADS